MSAEQTWTVVLTEVEFVTLCGLVQDDEDVESALIFSHAWPMLRDKFPISNFREGVERGVVEYAPE